MSGNTASILTTGDTQATGKVLLVEDTLALARTYLGYLRNESYHIQHVTTLKEAQLALEDNNFDAVILDLKLPDGNGMSLLNTLQQTPDAPPVIVITAQGSISAAVDAMRVGATDFLVKPFSAERLGEALANLVETTQFARKLAKMEETGEPPLAKSETRTEFHGFVGSSMIMQGVYASIRRAAKSNATVFITGESGTGKEVTAHAIHAESPRAKKPFIPLNCAAIPSELMESEIFGHLRGAFTGAVSDKIGAARAADGGTLFLDEICEMSPHLQTKLLRFVQTGTFNSVGNSKMEQVNVRFVCATNRDPLTEIAAGRFREDLYYRLHVIPLRLPPLRERGEDVLQISQKFLKQYAEEENKQFSEFSEETKNTLLAYPWPGNIRQLQNVLRNAVVLNDGEQMQAEMLPAPVYGVAESTHSATTLKTSAQTASLSSITKQSTHSNDLANLSTQIRPLAEIEREAIESAVDLCEGDVRKAAVFLGVSAATIYRKQKTWRETPQ